MTLPEVGGDQLRAEHRARQWWDTARRAIRCGEAADLIRLTRPEMSGELTRAVAEHGDHLRQVIRYDLAADASSLRWVTKLREMAAGDPEDGMTLAAQARLDLVPDEEFHRSAVAAEIMATVADALKNADELMLTAPADVKLKVPKFQVATPTLANSPAARAHLHGAVRKAHPAASGHGSNAAPDPSPAPDGQLGDAGEPQQPPSHAGDPSGRSDPRGRSPARERHGAHALPDRLRDSGRCFIRRVSL